MRRMAWRPLASLTGALLVGGVLAACEAPPPAQLYGMHGDYTFDVDAGRWKASIAADKAIGARISRNTLRWNAVEKVPGQYDWRQTDAVVDELRAKGIEPILGGYRVPPWANGASTNDPDAYRIIPSDTNGFNRFLGYYKRFMSKAAARYKGKVKYWEIWNEPNEYWFFLPRGLNLSVAADRQRWISLYAQIYTATRTVMLQVDSSLKISPGAITGLNASCCIRGLDFISSLIDRGAPLNYLAINAYASRQQAPWATIQYERNFSDIQLVRNLLNSRGHASTVMWLTEWGWQTGARVSGSSRTQLRAGGDQYRLALWPAKGQVVVNRVTRNYSSINRSAGNVITLTMPLPQAPADGTEISSPQAEATQNTYVTQALKMIKGTYSPAAGRPRQNYSYIKLTTYFVSYDRDPYYTGLFRTPQPDYAHPPDAWIIPRKPAANGFASVVG